MYNAGSNGATLLARCLLAVGSETQIPARDMIENDQPPPSPLLCHRRQRLETTNEDPDNPVLCSKILSRCVTSKSARMVSSNTNEKVGDNLNQRKSHRTSGKSHHNDILSKLFTHYFPPKQVTPGTSYADRTLLWNNEIEKQELSSWILFTRDSLLLDSRVNHFHVLAMWQQRKFPREQLQYTGFSTLVHQLVAARAPTHASPAYTGHIFDVYLEPLYRTICEVKPTADSTHDSASEIGKLRRKTIGYLARHKLTEKAPSRPQAQRVIPVGGASVPVIQLLAFHREALLALFLGYAERAQLNRETERHSLGYLGTKRQNNKDITTPPELNVTNVTMLLGGALSLVSDFGLFRDRISEGKVRVVYRQVLQAWVPRTRIETDQKSTATTKRSFSRPRRPSLESNGSRITQESGPLGKSRKQGLNYPQFCDFLLVLSALLFPSSISESNSPSTSSSMSTTNLDIATESYDSEYWELPQSPHTDLVTSSIQEKNLKAVASLHLLLVDMGVVTHMHEEEVPSMTNEQHRNEELTRMNRIEIVKPADVNHHNSFGNSCASSGNLDHEYFQTSSNFYHTDDSSPEAQHQSDVLLEQGLSNNQTNLNLNQVREKYVDTNLLRHNSGAQFLPNTDHPRSTENSSEMGNVGVEDSSRYQKNARESASAQHQDHWVSPATNVGKEASIETNSVNIDRDRNFKHSGDLVMQQHRMMMTSSDANRLVVQPHPFDNYTELDDQQHLSNESNWSITMQQKLQERKSNLERSLAELEQKVTQEQESNQRMTNPRNENNNNTSFHQHVSMSIENMSRERSSSLSQSGMTHLSFSSLRSKYREPSVVTRQLNGEMSAASNLNHETEMISVKEMKFVSLDECVSNIFEIFNDPNGVSCTNIVYLLRAAGLLLDIDYVEFVSHILDKRISQDSKQHISLSDIAGLRLKSNDSLMDALRFVLVKSTVKSQSALHRSFTNMNQSTPCDYRRLGNMLIEELNSSVSEFNEWEKTLGIQCGIKSIIEALKLWQDSTLDCDVLRQLQDLFSPEGILFMRHFSIPFHQIFERYTIRGDYPQHSAVWESTFLSEDSLIQFCKDFGIYPTLVSSTSVLQQIVSSCNFKQQASVSANRSKRIGMSYSGFIEAFYRIAQTTVVGGCTRSARVPEGVLNMCRLLLRMDPFQDIFTTDLYIAKVEEVEELCEAEPGVASTRVETQQGKTLDGKYLATGLRVLSIEQEYFRELYLHFTRHDSFAVEDVRCDISDELNCSQFIALLRHADLLNSSLDQLGAIAIFRSHAHSAGPSVEGWLSVALFPIAIVEAIVKAHNQHLMKFPDELDLVVARCISTNFRPLVAEIVADRTGQAMEQYRVPQNQGSIHREVDMVAGHLGSVPNSMGSSLRRSRRARLESIAVQSGVYDTSTLSVLHTFQAPLRQLYRRYATGRVGTTPESSFVGSFESGQGLTTEMMWALLEGFNSSSNGIVTKQDFELGTEVCLRYKRDLKELRRTGLVDYGITPLSEEYKNNCIDFPSFLELFCVLATCATSSQLHTGTPTRTPSDALMNLFNKLDYSGVVFNIRSAIDKRASDPLQDFLSHDLFRHTWNLKARCECNWCSVEYMPGALRSCDETKVLSWLFQDWALFIRSILGCLPKFSTNYARGYGCAMPLAWELFMKYATPCVHRRGCKFSYVVFPRGHRDHVLSEFESESSQVLSLSFTGAKLALQALARIIFAPWLIGDEQERRTSHGNVDTTTYPELHLHDEVLAYESLVNVIRSGIVEGLIRESYGWETSSLALEDWGGVSIEVSSNLMLHGNALEVLLDPTNGLQHLFELYSENMNTKYLLNTSHECTNMNSIDDEASNMMKNSFDGTHSVGAQHGSTKGLSTDKIVQLLNDYELCPSPFQTHQVLRIVQFASNMSTKLGVAAFGGMQPFMLSFDEFVDFMSVLSLVLWQFSQLHSRTSTFRDIHLDHSSQEPLMNCDERKFPGRLRDQLAKHQRVRVHALLRAIDSSNSCETRQIESHSDLSTLMEEPKGQTLEEMAQANLLLDVRLEETYAPSDLPTRKKLGILVAAFSDSCSVGVNRTYSFMTMERWLTFCWYVGLLDNGLLFSDASQLFTCLASPFHPPADSLIYQHDNTAAAAQSPSKPIQVVSYGGICCALHLIASFHMESSSAHFDDIEKGPFTFMKQLPNELVSPTSTFSALVPQSPALAIHARAREAIAQEHVRAMMREMFQSQCYQPGSFHGALLTRAGFLRCLGQYGLCPSVISANCARNVFRKVLSSFCVEFSVSRVDAKQDSQSAALRRRRRKSTVASPTNRLGIMTRADTRRRSVGDLSLGMCSDDMDTLVRPPDKLVGIRFAHFLECIVQCAIFYSANNSEEGKLFAKHRRDMAKVVLNFLHHARPLQDHC